MSYKYSSRQLVQRSAWLDRVMALPDGKLAPTTKVVVNALSHDFAVRGEKHTQMSKIWLPNLADYSGLSTKTVGQHVDYLSSVGAVMKEIRRERGEDRTTRPRIWIAFSPQFCPDILLILPDRPQRKDRQRVPIQCPHCGEYHTLRAYTTYYCTGCSSEIEELRETKEIENCAPGAESKEQLLASMDEQAELYEATTSFADMPKVDSGREEEVETFKRAMRTVKGANGTWETF